MQTDKMWSMEYKQRITGGGVLSKTKLADLFRPEIQGLSHPASPPGRGFSETPEFNPDLRSQ